MTAGKLRVIQEGTTIGAYTVQDRIGQGASAVVHRGWHNGLQRTVAMKFLPNIHEATAKARFVRESRALRRLDHPNIVQVLDTGEHEGTPYIVFDFIAGGSLGDRIAQEPLTDGEALAVLDGIAKGLDFAHRQNIVHRDVKPANVLLDMTGSPVIVDFGLARLMEQPSATATGLFAGTPAYMSPEQAEGNAIGPAADQYSLSALAYELMTGQVPFPGDTVSEVLVALLTRAPEAPSVLRPGLARAVDEALLRGLDKDPANRWPSCQALTDAILTAMYSSAPAPRVAVVAAAAATAVACCYSARGTRWAAGRASRGSTASGAVEAWTAPRRSRGGSGSRGGSSGARAAEWRRGRPARGRWSRRRWPVRTDSRAR